MTAWIIIGLLLAVLVQNLPRRRNVASERVEFLRTHCCGAENQKAPAICREVWASTLVADGNALFDAIESTRSR